MSGLAASVLAGLSVVVGASSALAVSPAAEVANDEVAKTKEAVGVADPRGEVAHPPSAEAPTDRNAESSGPGGPGTEAMASGSDAVAPPPTADPSMAANPPSAADSPSSAGAGSEEATDAEPDEPEAPASLPGGPATPPPDAKARERARGGGGYTPLPPPPAAEDPSTITPAGPWRGRGWLGLGLGVSIPVGGQVPARGGVVAVVGEVTVGWRILPFLALHTSISSFAHDAGQRTLMIDGQAIDEVAVGRVTAFDLVTARLYLPRPGRFEPWAELGGGIGVRRGPFADAREAAGLARFGVGGELWLAPTFTLGASAAYRLMVLDKTVGHGLRAGLDLGIHW